LINGLCKESLFDKAEALFLKMEDNDFIRDAVSYETIIRSLFYKDYNEKA
jgi:pentatricopeptide repeat domain-containing protein 1